MTDDTLPVTDEPEGPVLNDAEWSWSVTKALVASGIVGLGAVVWALWTPSVGALLIIGGVLTYILSPSVRGPITS